MSKGKKIGLILVGLGVVGVVAGQLIQRWSFSKLTAPDDDQGLFPPQYDGRIPSGAAAH